MKYFLNTTIAFFLFISVSSGQFSPTFQEFLEESMIFIDEEINPIGLSISVRSADNVWSGALGISSVQDSLTSSSILAMGSITKTFVSAGILKLIEENKLTLNDPLHLYLPNYDHIDSTITIKELLNHTSGVNDYSWNPDYWDTVETDSIQFYTYSPEEVIEQFVLEKDFDRGTKQEYSNTNYLLLGMIITEIANRPFYEEIFETFNVSQNYPSISYPPFNSEISELANVWIDLGQGLQNVAELGIGLDGLFSSTGASGAFVGTASDLSQWGYDLYSGKLLSESSMDSLFNFHPFLMENGYGLGVSNIPMSCGINAVGHNGAIYYGADLAYSEELDLSVAIMTNDGDGLLEIGGLGGITDEIICAYKNSLTTSSNEIIEKEKVEIYPNPVSDDIHIILPKYFNQSVQIKVYTEIGSLVYSQKLRNDHQQILKIDCFTKQAKGFYFVKIFDEENAYVTKVIKQ
ncbi:MAG: serine hydrolase [Saprospiraceae bacterium]